MNIKKNRIQKGFYCDEDIKIIKNYIYFKDSAKNEHRFKIIKHELLTKESDIYGPKLSIETDFYINQYEWHIKLNYFNYWRFLYNQNEHLVWIYNNNNIKYLIGGAVGAIPTVGSILYKLIKYFNL